MFINVNKKNHMCKKFEANKQKKKGKTCLFIVLNQNL